jgi:hypothetical protein
MKLHGHVYFQSNCYLDLYIVHSQKSVIWWLSVLLVEGTGRPGENHCVARTINI